MPDRPLAGVVAAVVTPFREDERIDYGAWQRILDRLIAAGVDGILAGGSTGEFFSLDFEERTVAMRFCRQAAAGRVTVYGNVGAITTRETVNLALAAEAEGLDAVAVVTPYYVQPSQDELAEHFSDVCRAVRIPVLAYNFPQHGGVELEVDTVAQVGRRHANLAGVKDSSGDIGLVGAFRNCVPDRKLAVFVGPESLLGAALEAGGAGVVSGCSNVAPRLLVDLLRAYREGRREDAAHLQQLSDDLSSAVGLHTFPSVLKEAMRLVGVPAGPCRKPIGAVKHEVRSRVAAVIERLKREGYATAGGSAVTA